MLKRIIQEVRALRREVDRLPNVRKLREQAQWQRDQRARAERDLNELHRHMADVSRCYAELMLATLTRLREARDMLAELDRKGGLGLDVHRKLREQVTSITCVLEGRS